MISALIVSLLATTPAPHVKSLYCTGQDAVSGTAGSGSAIVVFQPDTMQFRIRTKTLAAAGRGKADAGSYSGVVQAADGSRHEFLLDRYSGEFALYVRGADGRAVKTEFTGICRDASLR